MLLSVFVVSVILFLSFHVYISVDLSKSIESILLSLILISIMLLSLFLILTVSYPFFFLFFYVGVLANLYCICRPLSNFSFFSDFFFITLSFFCLIIFFNIKAFEKIHLLLISSEYIKNCKT